MSAVIKINRNEPSTCGICLHEFSPHEVQHSHVGGEKHDGFHEECLKKALKQDPRCPYDRQPIDPSSLLSRTEQVMNKLKPALVNATWAASMGISAAATAAVMTAAMTPIIAGAAGAITSIIVGAAIISETRQATTDIDQRNIVTGLWAGAAGFFVITVAAGPLSPITALAITSLAAGAGAGTSSVMSAFQ